MVEDQLGIWKSDQELFVNIYLVFIQYQLGDTSVGNYLKYSDWEKILKVKDRDQDNSDSHKVQRWNI